MHANTTPSLLDLTLAPALRLSLAAARRRHRDAMVGARVAEERVSESTAPWGPDGNATYDLLDAHVEQGP